MCQSLGCVLCCPSPFRSSCLCIGWLLTQDIVDVSFLQFQHVLSSHEVFDLFSIFNVVWDSRPDFIFLQVHTQFSLHHLLMRLFPNVCFRHLCSLKKNEVAARAGKMCLALTRPSFVLCITCILASSAAYLSQISLEQSSEPSSTKIISISFNVWLHRLLRHLWRYCPVL